MIIWLTTTTLNIASINYFQNDIRKVKIAYIENLK